tara:strand:- start:79 stop:348 length:270 start_codon:yes stop_codon:yes gene_type:complete
MNSDTSTTSVSKKRGRPATEIQWPSEEFTPKQLKEHLSNSNVNLSNVSVQLKINQAVDQGVLEKAGVTKKSLGRPTVVYRRVSKNNCDL